MATAPFDNLGWIEIVFGGIVALGIGFWQLWSVNRDIARDKEKAVEKKAAEKKASREQADPSSDAE
ncbi:MAG: hypothetical protein AAF205_07670 [Pseudomonadota bacterium]